MTTYLERFYNSYVSAKPEVRINKPSQTSRGLLSRTVHKRIKINGIDTKEFDNMYWLKYFAFIRAKELGRDWTQTTFDRLIKTAHEIMKLQGYDDALNFLNRRLRGAQPKLLSLTNDAAHDKIKLDFENKSIFQPFRLF